MKKNSYNRFWRLHFYAALFITPLLITLTLSGIGYLFYTDVENVLYDDLFFGDSDIEEAQSIDQAIEQANNTYDDFRVSRVIMLEDPYNTRLTLANGDGDQRYVFLDENNQVVGGQNANHTYSNVLRALHSSLFVGGTAVNYLVELAACWAIFLLVSGIYMTFKGKVLQNKKKTNKRQRTKKYHALLGLIITVPMVIIIFTGLPWSAVMGNVISTFSQENPSIGAPELKTTPPNSEVNEIPWATRNNETPNSESHSHHHGEHAGSDLHEESMISIQDLISQIEDQNINKPYSIIYPSTKEGTFTVSKGSNSGVTGLDVSPDEEITNYFDQYSGTFVDSVSYEEYGVLQKWFSWGIPLHEGHLFGWPNKILNLLVCIGFLVVIFLGFKTWLSRKKKGSFSAPIKVSNKISASFIVLMIALGIIMPLFGLSLIIIVIIELIIRLFAKYNQET
ncbi:PepSY-associated TM helix domain-containing protein [Oceanobacillus kimchii]|uniref:PepSY domain-containing protein n=1 Tax=Oceanobacillus kimchii TaxID=746691 RepID=A0ABQ5TG10_9BACI|nr:PepSY domain-containing protein [Oceanobacillus kimchii]GLO64529.1 PepSY domain-containing protein [Oceanobacillus kimchii]